MRTIFAALLVALSGIVTGCDLLGSNDEAPDTVSAGIFIGNQGNFSTGDGSVSLLDPESGEAPTVLRDLESIVQSIAVHDGRLYVAANTGGRIDVFDAGNRSRIGSIEGLVSPRYMAFSAGRLFVTNLYPASDTSAGGTVSVVDLSTRTAVAEIEVGPHPEGIVAVDGRLFVANADFGSGSTLSVIDVASLTVVETIDVDCEGPRYLIADSDGDVFVFCTGKTIYTSGGDVLAETDGAIRVVDSATGSIKRSFSVAGRMMASEFGQDAFFDATSRRIYALRRQRLASSETAPRFDVVVIDAAQNDIVGTIGPFEGHIGGVAYDSEEDVLYLTRIDGFTRAGTVETYQPDGTLVRSTTVGVAPTSIVPFRPE